MELMSQCRGTSSVMLVIGMNALLRFPFNLCVFLIVSLFGFDCRNGKVSIEKRGN